MGDLGWVEICVVQGGNFIAFPSLDDGYHNKTWVKDSKYYSFDHNIDMTDSNMDGIDGNHAGHT